MKFLSIFILSISAWAAPTVSNIRIDDITHSSARITWDADALSNCQKTQYGPTAAYGTTQGTYQCTGAFQGADGSTNQQAILSGLAPSTTYHICPQSSTDSGATWSTCVDANFTTLALPAVHPALPTAPTTFPTTGLTGAGSTLTVGSNCLDGSTGLQARMNAAVAGDIVEIPTTTTNCTGQFTLPNGANSKAIGTVDTTANTLVVTSHGWSANQQVRLGSEYDTLPTPLKQGVTYYVIVTDANTIQLAATSGGAAIDLTSAGITALRIIAWPTTGNYITVRSASYTSLPPEGIQVTSSFSSVMASLVSSVSNVANQAATISIKGGILSHHWQFIGIHFKMDNSHTAGTVIDPRPYWGWLHFQAHTDSIVFSRCYFHGTGYPERLVRATYLWNCSNCSIRDSYFENIDYWRPYMTVGSEITVTRTSASVLTISTGSVQLGSATRTISSTQTATITGGSVSGTAFVYMALDGTVTVDAPSGLTFTCSGCTAVNSATPAIPTNADSEWTALRLATVTVTTGTWASASNYSASDYSTYSTEGSTAIFGQYGGPHIITNNRLECVGICVYWSDDSIGVAMPQDITVSRNLFTHSLTKMAGGGTTDGRKYSHRQPIQFKIGQRILVDGNIIENSWQEITTNGYSIVVISNSAFNPGQSANETSDIKISNNTIRNSSGGIQITSAPFGSTLAKIIKRVLITNNLFDRLDGWTYTSPTGVRGTLGAAGIVYSIGHGAEDVQIYHDTIYQNSGAFPWLLGIYSHPTEGFIFRDILAWVTGDNGLGVVSGDAGSVDNSPSCTSSGEKALLDCIMLQGIGTTSYTWNRNVLVAGYTNSQANTGNVSTSTLTSNYAASPSTLIPTGSAVSDRVTAVRFVDSANQNYQLKAGGASTLSPYNRGGATPASDGLEIGSNPDTRNIAQSLVYNIRASTTATTTATISFTAPEASTSCYVLHGSGADPTAYTQSAANTTAARQRNVNLTGLTTATTYNLLVGCVGTQLYSGSFRTY